MSGADEKIRTVLEQVAQDQIDACGLRGYEHTLYSVLERRLLPLLLAGQAMRDGVIGASGGLKRIQLARAWDEATLAAAQGQPERKVT